ncbi:MAG: hypothetical protein R3B09_20620 [Nannocystaceae bacterium]
MKAASAPLAALLALMTSACGAPSPRSEPAPSGAAATPSAADPSKDAVDVRPAKAPESWMEFSSDEGRCKLRFPAAPRSESMDAPSPAGPIPTTTIAAEQRGAYYALAYSDYPVELVAESKLDNILDGARNGAVNNIGGTLLKEEQITFAGQKARAFEASASAEGMEVRLSARIFFVAPRLYVLLVVYPAGQVDAEAQRFFDSFELKASP